MIFPSKFKILLIISSLFFLLIFSIKELIAQSTDTTFDYSCGAAVVYMIDKSGSMSEETDNGSSILHRVKDAAIQSLNHIPTGQWNMGLTTFPDQIGVPTGGAILTLITDQPNTREQFRATIHSLSPGGSTNIIAGGYQSLSLLQQDNVRPRFLTIFSDGEVCSEDPGPFGIHCNQVRAMADSFRRDFNIFIATVGYQLSGNDAEIMREIASMRPNGTKAFVNATSGSQLFQMIEREIGGICKYQPISIKIKPEQAIIATGGSSSHELTATYLVGPELTYHLYAAFNSTALNIKFLVSQITLGPSKPTFSTKIVVGSTGNSPEPIYYSNIYAVSTESLGPAAVASGRIISKISDFSAQVSIIEESGTPFWVGGKYRGKIKIKPVTSDPLQITINLMIRKKGINRPATNWKILLTPQPTANIDSSTPEFSTKFELEPPNSGSTGEEYEIQAIVIGNGSMFTSNIHTFPIP